MAAARALPPASFAPLCFEHLQPRQAVGAMVQTLKDRLIGVLHVHNSCLSLFLFFLINGLLFRESFAGVSQDVRDIAVNLREIGREIVTSAADVCADVRGAA